MTTYILIGFSTDARETEPRYRAFTTSEKLAGEFAQIPRISFSDGGHGIEFRSVVHEGGKRGKPVSILADYVEAQLALMRARKTKDGRRAIEYLEHRLEQKEQFRMSLPTIPAHSLAAKFVDDTMLLQRLGEEAAAQHGITREQIKSDHLSDERIGTEQLAQGSYSKFVHFPDGSDAAQVRGSKRWEVWR